MSYSNGIISAPVSTADIRKALGTSETKLSALCTHSGINAYSKHKPVASSSRDTLTDDLFKEVNWGYRIPDGAALKTVFDGYTGGTAPSTWAAPSGSVVDMGKGWYYVKPSGGNASPYRQGDFNKYNPSVEKSMIYIDSNLINQTFNQKTTSGSFYIGFYQFKLSDFNELSGKKLGIAIRTSSGGNLYFKTSDDGENVTLDSSELNTVFSESKGTWYAIPFVTGGAAQNINRDSANYVSQITDAIPLPTPSYFTITKVYTNPTTLNGAKVTVKITDVGERKITLNITVEAKEAVTVVWSNFKYKVSCYNDDNTYVSSEQSLGLSGSTNLKANASATSDAKTISYAAYKELIAPWYVEVSVYYPNSDDVSTLVGNGASEYDG